MPTIELDSVELIKLQSKLAREEIEPPESIPDLPEWQEQTGGYVEDYIHTVGLDRALMTIMNMCPICGDTECDRGVAYVGASPIHSDQHPDVKAERAMEEQGSHL